MLLSPLAGRNGGSLSNRLLLLMLVPIFGGSLAVAVQVQLTTDAAQAAQHGDAFIRSAAGLVRIQADFGQEVVPAFAATVLREPATLGPGDVTMIVRALGGASNQLRQLRATTNAAVAAVAVSTAERAVLVAKLAASRAGIDHPKVLVAALSGGIPFLDSLSAVENERVASAARAGVDADGTRALQDVTLTARASQVATSELPAYAATQLLSSEVTAHIRFEWSRAWSAFDIASRDVAQRTAAATAHPWAEVNALPAVKDFNTFLAAQANLGAPPATLARVLQLIVEDSARNRLYTAVLSSTLLRALGAGLAQRTRALQQLVATMAVALLLLTIAVTVSILIRRSITRPLERLAGQATRVSEGQLVDVQISGPREVQTVARALSNSVQSLRDIQAHAEAVAAGDMDSTVLTQSLAGPLGQVVQSSVARIIDATKERKLAQTQLAHRAAHDALTELPNRAQALIFIEQALHRAQRSGNNTALMFIDLDRFKNVNDTYGHAVGDEVLQIVSKRMLETVRDGDSVARLGGDEFVVLLEGVGDELAIATLAERLIANVSLDMEIDHRDVRVGATIGLAFCRDGWVDAERLLHEADAALYRAKNAGRGSVDVFDDGLRRELRERSELERGMAEALLEHQFELHYQPVMSLATQATIGVEALIRWNRPGLGLVQPGDFIPVAERSTLVNDIGRWVLLEATAQLASWQRADDHCREMTVAVNISGTHLISTTLIRDVATALSKSGIAARQLIVEITETVLVNDDPIATNNLDQLRAMGVKISIDDFGTGFTSIGRLSTLRADSLKIDRSFVASPDPAQRALVDLIVSAAHVFGLTVVAEGIEDSEQAERMRLANVEHGQGFLYARPRPATSRFPEISLV